MDDDEAGMLAPIEGALPKIKPMTPVQRRRLESAAAIADDPPEGITFQHTVLCQTCMPYRDPGDSTRVWERQQGMISLRIEAGVVRDPMAHEYVDIGLPYGVKPRLILAHLNREALRQGSPRIEVENSLTAFIRRVTNYDSVNAREIGLFRHQLARFAAAGVRMAVDRPGRAYQINTHIIDAFDLWPGKDERQHVLWPAEVELSPRYFESLTNHAVPLDERALRALANSPMALDVYAWLAQRLHRVDPRRPQFITWKALQDQFGQGFKRLRKFRETFLDVLDTVHSQYRAARVEADERGIALRHSPPPVKGRIAIAPRPTATVEQSERSTTEEAPAIPNPDHLRMVRHVAAKSSQQAREHFWTKIQSFLQEAIERGDISGTMGIDVTLEDGTVISVTPPAPSRPASETLDQLRRIFDDKD